MNKIQRIRPEGIVPNFDLSTGSAPTDTSGDN